MPTTPVFVLGICAITVFFTYRAFRSPALRDRLIFDPRLILGEKQWYRMLSSALIHADWMHCLFNLVSFYLFAEALEAIFGGWVVLAIYVASIFGGELLSLFLHRHHEYTSLGASGGVCGIIFASIFLMPGTEISMFYLPIGIPGWAYALLYLCAAFIGAKKHLGNIGHEAHFGGAVVGLLAALIVEPAACLAFPFHYFGALIFAVACLAAFIFDPRGLRMQAFENRQGNLRYQRYDEARERNERKAELDAILDKISQKGIGSLSKRERVRLEEESAKNSRGR